MPGLSLAPFVVAEDTPRYDADDDHDEEEHQQPSDDIVEDEGQDGLSFANQSAAGKDAPQAAHPAKHKHHVRIDGIRKAHGRRDRFDWGQHCPGNPGKTATKRKNRHIDSSGVDSKTGGYRPIAPDRPDLEAKIGFEDHIENKDQQQDSHNNEEQPVPWKWQPPDRPETAFEDFGSSDVVQLRTEDELNDSLEDDADTPGGQERFQWPVVDPLNDAAFYDQ